MVQIPSYLALLSRPTASLHRNRMATTTTEGLESFLEALSISSRSLASIAPDIYSDPLSLCYSHLAELLVQLTECEQHVAYKSIVWASDMTHLVVVAPRLRVKGVKPDDLATDLQQKVSNTLAWSSSSETLILA